MRTFFFSDNAKKIGNKLYTRVLLSCFFQKVTIIRTGKIGHARHMMESFRSQAQLTDFDSEADTLLIAGGDGTLLEALTGFMRRTDQEIVGKEVALGKNSVFSQFLQLYV